MSDVDDELRAVDTDDPYFKASQSAVPALQDTENTAYREITRELIQGGVEGTNAFVGGMEYEPLEDAFVALCQRARVDSLLAGRVAYEIRLRTERGEWEQERRKLAMASEVSERTIARWMRTAQEHFGFELTEAQQRAPGGENYTAPDYSDVTSDSVSRESIGEDVISAAFAEDDWDESADAGFTDGEAEYSVTQQNREAGWGDDTLPSADYTNVEPTPNVGKSAPIPPDDQWVAFTASQMQTEHPALGDDTARRNAKARWGRMIREAPTDLLEELEIIYEFDGRTVPDEYVQILQEAQEAADAPITPEVVKAPKKAAKPKTLKDQMEAVLDKIRELHSSIHQGVESGAVTDDMLVEAYSIAQGLAYTADGLRKKCAQAKERVGARERNANVPAGENRSDAGASTSAAF